MKSGVIHKAYVFVSALGFSQLLFAWQRGHEKRNCSAPIGACSAFTAARPTFWYPTA